MTDSILSSPHSWQMMELDGWCLAFSPFILFSAEVMTSYFTKISHFSTQQSFRVSNHTKIVKRIKSRAHNLNFHFDFFVASPSHLIHFQSPHHTSPHNTSKTTAPKVKRLQSRGHREKPPKCHNCSKAKGKSRFRKEKNKVKDKPSQ